MRSIGSILSVLICACFPAASWAQHPTTAPDQAAPISPHVAAPQISEYVREVFQDRDGDYWFGTNGDGVCRYDGKTFTAFREDPGLIINGRPARSHVQEFFEDKNGVLWLGCSGGLFRFDGKSFINVTQNGPWPKSPSRPAPRVTAQ